jgi:dethiobiotin synthetase
LNHTLLTLEVARHRGLAVAGVIVSETTPVLNTAEQTNVEELRKRIDVPLLAVIPYQMADAAELERIDWRRLAARNGDRD